MRTPVAVRPGSITAAASADTRTAAAVPPTWPARLLPAAVLLTAVTVMASNRVDTDLWGHVQYGREALRQGELSRTTTWSYLTTGHLWINHEVLAELALAWTADQFGIIGLTLGKLALSVLLVACLIAASRGSGAGWLATAIVVVTAAKTMEFHWHFRPQAITYTLFAVMIAALDWVFRDWRGDWRGWRTLLHGEPRAWPLAAARRLNWLLALPPLFVLWANSHGGFAAGLAVLVAYLGLRAVEAWAWWGRAALPLMVTLAGGAVLAILATFLNPYDAELHAWLIADVLPARPEIADWRPLDLLHDPDACGLWVLLGLGAVGLTWSSRRKDFTQLVLLAIILWQAVAHCRHLAFFAILCGCWLAPYLQEVVDRIATGLHEKLSEHALRLGRTIAPRSLTAASSPWVIGGLLGWCAIMAALLIPRLGGIPVRRDWYPVAAMQYVHDRGLTGRFLCEFNWAQYAIMCFAEGPPAGWQSRVAVDGRLRTCYPWETLDVAMDFFMGDPGPEWRNRSPHSPPFQADRALQLNNPDLVLLWREQTHGVQVMEQHSAGWVLLYQDALAQLWGRRDRYDNPASSDYVPSWQRSISEAPQIGAVDWPALPR